MTTPLAVTVPTFRPDIRPVPMGEADIAEEVARTYGYVRIARRMPSWPQPGRLTDRQRDRRLLKEVLCGLGCSEAWTTTFVSDERPDGSRAEPPYVEVTNPLVDSERFLRTSMVSGTGPGRRLQRRDGARPTSGSSRWGRCSVGAMASRAPPRVERRPRPRSG